MSQPDPAREAGKAPIPDERVEAGVYRTAAGGFERGLVVLAMGLPYWLEPAGDDFRLLVEPRQVGAVRDQLARYERESVGWPPRPIVDSAARETDLITPMLWAVLVFLCFWAQGEWRTVTAAGAMDATAVFARGEWWRAVSALFLHADGDHLLSNVLGGIFVFAAVLSTLGRLRGWLLLGLTASIANLAVAAASYPQPYRSLGASTAVFAGLGLLTGRAIRVVARARHPHRWRALFLPFASGVTVLALYGAGGVNVDVPAHLAGFCAGAAGGFLGAPAGHGGTK